jgi:transposase
VEHIGIDLGSRESQICVRQENGTIVEEKRWPTAKLHTYLKRRPPGRVLLESSSEAFAVADISLACGHETKVVASILVRSLGVGHRGIKNDVRDARAMSEASCRLELPSIHISSKRGRELKAICGSRDALVECRTKLVNTVRSWMRTKLESVRSGATPTFPDRVREKLLDSPDGVPGHIDGLLLAIETLSEQIKEADKELKRIAEADEICSRLMTLPGVGPVTAVRFVAAIDQVDRFRNAHELESYLGLTPGENVTGFKGHRTRITKAGQSKVRWTLVQAAWTAMRTRPHDPMAKWAGEVAKRRGRRIAAVALARKIAGILYAMWRDGTSYKPAKAASVPPTSEADAKAA